MTRTNHWVSALGRPDHCAACGLDVPNASGQPCIVTGDCKGPPVETIRHLLFLCPKCCARPPFYGQAHGTALSLLGHPMLRLVVPKLRPGWCQVCRRWVGDAALLVPSRPPVVDLVEALVESFSW